MQNILITGGTGYLGSHTALSLLLRGYKVIVLDSNINSSYLVIRRIKEILQKTNRNYIKNLTFIKGDLREYFFLHDLFSRSIENGNYINSVIHFCGLKSVAESKSYPLDYWDVNVGGTINLLKNMDKFNCKNLIFSSSATIYGEKNKPPFKESVSLDPVNPYANTKATVEKMLWDFFQSKKEKWKIINLRYFNPIGAHGSGLLGEDPLGAPNNLFPQILNAFYKNKKILIFGNDWPTPDGTCIRDYIHVEDLVEGHIRALETSFSYEDGFDSINLGTGQGTSVLELIKSFEIANNCSIDYEFVGRREGDTAILIADNSYALKKLNWEPKKNIYDMCQDGCKWINLNPNGYSM